MRSSCRSGTRRSARCRPAAGTARHSAAAASAIAPGSRSARRHARASTRNAYRCRLPVCSARQPAGAALGERGQPVQRAVDEDAVADSQEDAVRDPGRAAGRAPPRRARRCSTCRTAAGAAGSKRGCSRAARAALPPKKYAGASSRPPTPIADRDPRPAGSWNACSARAPRGSGSIGSRKCGIEKKPPTADSSASTISTPVIDSGDSCTWCSTSSSIRGAPKNVSHSRRNM